VSDRKFKNLQDLKLAEQGRASHRKGTSPFRDVVVLGEARVLPSRGVFGEEGLSIMIAAVYAVSLLILVVVLSGNGSDEISSKTTLLLQSSRSLDLQWPILQHCVAAHHLLPLIPTVGTS